MIACSSLASLKLIGITSPHNIGTANLHSTNSVDIGSEWAEHILTGKYRTAVQL